MDLERTKQSLRRLAKLLNRPVVSEETEQHKDTQPDSFETYTQMTRQQRRAYQRRFEKEMRRKSN